MKNFPHQMNDIPKLVSALETYQKLSIEGKDVNDDGVFGYAMAENLIYTFRNQPDNSINGIRQRILIEKNKPKGSQGARTAARDIRRFFDLAHFISENEVSELGKRVIKAGNDVSDLKVIRLWHKAMLSIALPAADDVNRVSHPYRIMLEIIKHYPNIGRDKLALALEAEDDSEEEFDRILQIAQSKNWADLINCSDHQRKNAVKILPSIARQIGDIDTEGHVQIRKYIVKPEIQRFENEEEQDANNNRLIQSKTIPAQSKPYTGHPKEKEETILVAQKKVYPRDRSVAINALRLAGNKCEIDSNHATFIRRIDHLPYTEPHHLIPLAFSESFDVSLDIEENIVSLCSNCHNAIHYGIESKELITQLFNKRSEMLNRVGLDITIEELLDMY